MDFVTLAAAVLLGIGLLGADSVLHTGSVAVDVTAPAAITGNIIGQETLEDAFTGQLDAIAATQSVVNPPEIRAGRDGGIGMSLAEAVGLRSVAFALQRQFGYDPDRLHFGLYMADTTLRGVVSGRSHVYGAFAQEFVPEPHETLRNFAQRLADWGASQLAPYNTALFLLQRHAGDGDFRDVVALCNHAIDMLPPAPINPTRGQFQNLLGLVALFGNDPKAAHARFAAAGAAWPDAPVPELNLAFTELQTDQYEAALHRVRALLARMSDSHPAVNGTAHMTLGAALMGLHDDAAADAELAQALRSNPDSSAVPELWAQLKERTGDAAGAARLHALALQNTTSFENFGELAALYFQLSWRDNEPVTRSRFSNPGVVIFH